MVFASDTDRAVAGSELHASFKLSSSGEYLALIDPDGTTVISEFSPTYPAQAAAYSYGVGTSRLGDEVTTYDTPRLVAQNGWAEDTLSFDLHVDTRYLAVRIGAHQNANGTGFISSYADDVGLKLNITEFIENPNPGPSPVPSGGSTAVFLFTGLLGLTLAGKRKGAEA